jgi:hypothetical protein
MHPRGEARTSTLRSESLANGTTRLFTEKGAVEYSFPLPDVVLARYSGTLTAELYTEVVDIMARRLAVRPTLRLFADLGDITDYDAGFREGWAGWFRTHRKSVGELHVLFRSRLVGIGLTVIGVATGGNITTYSDRAAFERVVPAARAP